MPRAFHILVFVLWEVLVCVAYSSKSLTHSAVVTLFHQLVICQIWSFTMKSPCCKHEIVIQTDPKNTEYVIIKGGEKKTEDFDVEDAETLLLPADEGSTCKDLHSFITITYFQMPDILLWVFPQIETS